MSLAHWLACGLLGGVPAALISGEIMSFSSTIQVLKVENEERISNRTKATYNHFAARVILLTDDGEVDTVGVINSRRITPELRDSMKLGTFRATFALRVPDYGDDKGDVICMLTGLVPVTLRNPPAKVQAHADTNGIPPKV